MVKKVSREQRVAIIRKLKRKLKEHKHKLATERQEAGIRKQLLLTRGVARSIWRSIKDKDQRLALTLLTGVAAAELRDQGIDFCATPWRRGTLYHEVPDRLDAAGLLVPARPYVVFAIPVTNDNGFAEPSVSCIPLQHRYLNRRSKDVVVQVLRNIFGDRLVWRSPRKVRDITISW